MTNAGYTTTPADSQGCWFRRSSFITKRKFRRVAKLAICTKDFAKRSIVPGKCTTNVSSLLSLRNLTISTMNWSIRWPRVTLDALAAAILAPQFSSIIRQQKPRGNNSTRLFSFFGFYCRSVRSDGNTGREASGLSGDVWRCTIFQSFPINLNTSVIRPDALSSFPSFSCVCFHLHET